MSQTLKVRNIAPDVTPEFLEQFFRIAGPVRQVIVENQNNIQQELSKTAIIIMATNKAAKRALNKLSHIGLNDRKLLIMTYK
jgi:RNA recognition motif-containing protein